MKLAAVVLGALLAVPSFAGAEILNPPGGPVDTGADVIAVDAPDPRMPRRHAPRAGDPRGENRQLREALVRRFDVNGDGKLGPRERVRAIRMLRRLERTLAAPMMQRGRGEARMRRFMRRYDVDRDGVVGPREVPSGVADRLRPLDRDGNGWVTPDELPRR